MKRTYVLAAIVLVEVIVAIVLFYNLKHFYSEGATLTGLFGKDEGTAATVEEIATGVEAPQQDEDGIAEIPAVIMSLFSPVPALAASEGYVMTDEIIDLGRMLWYDPRLSASQAMSCNTCHLLDQYGVDNLSVSIGHDGKPGSRNSPTVYNAALHVAQFWDGRAKDVEEQAKLPVLSMDEMGMGDIEHVEEMLRSIPGYAPFFQAAYPDDEEPINFENTARAIGAFERGLMLPSRFDSFLEGDTSQLTAQELQGFKTFNEVGCSKCHMGTPVGGRVYKKLGEIIPYDTDDLGRYEITKDEDDMHVFKVPSLRNVTQTFPYLHNGSVETLDEMVRIMAKHQLNKDLTETQVEEIIAFLGSLTGDIPQDYIAIPELPASGPDTPKPLAEVTR